LQKAVVALRSAVLFSKSSGGALDSGGMSKKQYPPRMRAPWVGRPQAARLQPVVRKAGLRTVKKPKK